MQFDYSGCEESNGTKQSRAERGKNKAVKSRTGLNKREQSGPDHDRTKERTEEDRRQAEKERTGI